MHVREKRVFDGLLAGFQPVASGWSGRSQPVCFCSPRDRLFSSDIFRRLDLCVCVCVFVCVCVCVFRWSSSDARGPVLVFVCMCGFVSTHLRGPVPLFGNTLLLTWDLKVCGCVWCVWGGGRGSSVSGNIARHHISLHLHTRCLEMDEI